MRPPRWRSSGACPWVLCSCVTSRARSRALPGPDGGGVRGQVLGAGEGVDVPDDVGQCPLVVLDEVDAAQERLHRQAAGVPRAAIDRKSTRLNSSHANISYAVFCLKKKNT